MIVFESQKQKLF